MRFELEKKEFLERQQQQESSDASRQRFCRGCCKMFIREPRRKLKYASYCSDECGTKMRGVFRCKTCESFDYHEVTFRDGSEHVKRVCVRCRHGQYVATD